MPYISPEDRARLSAPDTLPENAGQLNYTLTRIVLAYLGAAPNYQRYNDVLGVLEAMKLELYRRRIAPYEETKIAENGDVEGY